MSARPIEVTVPASAENVAVLRVMAGDAAAAAGLAYDRYEDLVLAVDELSTVVLTSAPRALRCAFDPSDSVVRVSMSAIEPTSAPARDKLAELVLGGIASDVEFALDHDPPQASCAIANA